MREIFGNNIVRQQIKHRETAGANFIRQTEPKSGLFTEHRQ